MIETLTSSGALYRLNRDRGAMTLACEKRKALLLCCAITVALSVATTLFIVYGT